MSSLHRIDLDELRARMDDLEALLPLLPDVDPWCSSPEWVLAVHDAFGEGSEPLVLAGPAGVSLLARRAAPDGRIAVVGLEPMWGFATPFLGTDLTELAEQTLGWLDADPSWSVLLLPGLPRTGPLTPAVFGHLAARGPTTAHEGIDRLVARLEDGVAAWSARRSRRFRRDERRDLERAEAAGVTFEIVDDDPDAFDRILAVEAKSWKAAADSGLSSPGMASLYRALGEQLRARGARRARIARLDGADIAYILGGCRGSVYRGLQLSYDHTHAELRLGHVLQGLELRRVAAEGIRTYDLGMDLDYKRRWADEVVGSAVIMHERGTPPVSPDR